VGGPRGSPTARAVEHAGAAQIFEGATDSGSWFSERSRAVKMCEEAFPLGRTGRVLTLLALEHEGEDDD